MTDLHLARLASIACAAVLAACVAFAALKSAPWPASLAWTAVSLVPVLLPLPGLLRNLRRAYAAATLCVTPYLVYGLTEVIANPQARGTATSILVASLAWFIALVHCLRLTGPASRPDDPPDR